jgi:ComF family protein
LCLAPGHAGLELCRYCREDLPWLVHACSRCAQPLGAPGGGVCPTCLNNPPVLDGCFALFSYQPPVDRWIHDLKFGRDLAAGRLLGELLADELPVDKVPADTLVLPVPLHAARLRQRGYNQSLEITRPLRRLGLKPGRCRCRRNRHTPAQSGLPAKNRHRNIRGAFSVRERLDGRRVLLVDDVMTTGATLNELARTLKRAGAARVEACVAARALRSDQKTPRPAQSFGEVPPLA